MPQTIVLFHGSLFNLQRNSYANETLSPFCPQQPNAGTESLVYVMGKRGFTQTSNWLLNPENTEETALQNTAIYPFHKRIVCQHQTRHLVWMSSKCAKHLPSWSRIGR